MEQALQVRADALDPNGIGIVHEKRRRAEKGQGSMHATAGLEETATFVRYDDFRHRPFAQVLFDEPREAVEPQRRSINLLTLISHHVANSDVSLVDHTIPNRQGSP